jgi:hypothetical protein
MKSKKQLLKELEDIEKDINNSNIDEEFNDVLVMVRAAQKEIKKTLTSEDLR